RVVGFVDAANILYPFAETVITTNICRRTSYILGARFLGLQKVSPKSTRLIQDRLKSKRYKQDEDFSAVSASRCEGYGSLMTDKTLSIIVPCSKLSRKPFWAHVLKSIVETNPHQIILINNSPKDQLNKTLDKVSKALVLEPGRNIGAAAAWNLGFKKSRGDCVLFSADDHMLHPQTVRKAVSLISKDVPFVYG